MRLFKSPIPPPAPEKPYDFKKKLPAEVKSAILDINMNRSRTNSIKGQPEILLVCREWYDLQIDAFRRKSQAYIKMTVKAHRRSDECILGFYKLKGDTKLKTSRPSLEEIYFATKRFGNASILSIRMIVDCCAHWETNFDCQCEWERSELEEMTDPLEVYEMILASLPNILQIRMHWENKAVGFEHIHYTWSRETPQHDFANPPQILRGRQEDTCGACKYTKRNPNVDSDQSGSSGSSNSHQGSISL